MDQLLSSFDSPVGIVKGYSSDMARTVKMGKSRRSFYGVSRFGLEWLCSRAGLMDG